MQQQQTATLATIFSEVLADLAFMFTDPDQSLVIGEGDWLETCVGYSGPDRGRLRFRCPAGFCTQLAANLLGLDPNDPDTRAASSDAVKEFMNVVCGHFVTAMYGTEKVFDLTIPEIRQLPGPPDLFGNDSGLVSTVAADGFTVQLEYEICESTEARE